MSQVVTNWIELKDLIDKILKECLHEIAEESAKYLKQFVEINWYNAHTPQIYNRTFQMLDAISRSEIKQKGNKFDVAIFFDTAKITPNYLGDGLWNEHMGFNGAGFTSGLIQTLEEGNPSPYSPSYSNDGIEMFKNTSDWLEKKLPSIASKIFAKHGLKVLII